MVTAPDCAPLTGSRSILARPGDEAGYVLDQASVHASGTRRLGTCRQRRAHQADVQPPYVHPALLGCNRSRLQRHLRDVQRCHIPASPGQPDCIRSLTAADV